MHTMPERYVAILGSLKESGILKLVMVPEGQSLDFDEGAATRRWLHPHLDRAWHLVAFVPFKKLEALDFYVAECVPDSPIEY